LAVCHRVIDKAGEAMKKGSMYQRKAEIFTRFAEFEFPPLQDVLLVGKRAPIGPEAVRRVAEGLSPQQYEIIEVEHETIEAVVIRRDLFKLIDKEKLLEYILAEGGQIVSTTMVVKAQMNITIQVNGAIDL
jgi:hypothetical protein